jgi:hypothetical protein
MCVLILGQTCHLVSERGALSLQRVRRRRRDAASRATTRRRLQGGDGHGAEAITMMSSSFVFESSTRCGIDDNMKASHRRVAAPATNMQQRARHGGVLAVKA